MKIIKLRNSLLFIRIHPEQDKVRCLFLFFVSWNCFLIEVIDHDLGKLSMRHVKEFYKQLADDYTAKYRIN